MSRRGWILFAALSLIWGIPYLLIRIAVRDFAPPTLLFFRTAPAGLLLLPFAHVREVYAALRSHWRILVVFAFVELGIPWLLLFRAEQRLSSSLSGLIIAMVPLITVALAKISRQEGAFGMRRLVGLCCGFAGVAVIVGIDVHGSDLIAVGEIVVVAIGYSCGPLIIAAKLSDIPALVVISASLLINGVAYAPIALTHLPQHVSPEEIASVVILMLVCTALAFVIFFDLVTEIGASRSTVVTYINPAVAVVLGVVILHEHFSTGIALGFPLVVLGSYLSTGGARRPIEFVDVVAQDDVSPAGDL